MMRALKFNLVPLLSVFAITNAHSLPFSLEITEAGWYNPVHGSNIEYEDADSVFGFESISWGLPVNIEQSGYDIDMANSTFSGVAPNETFLIGEFTHHNYVMKRGTSIYEASLSLGLTVSSAGDQQDLELSFLFDHTETSNNCSSSPTCSNDRVEIFGNGNNLFSFGDSTYEFSLLGFIQDGSLTEVFSTLENHSNTATLVASINSVSVPEPESFGLLSIGLLGLLYASKRKLRSS